MYFIFILLGALLLAFAFSDLQYRLSFLKRGERCIGTVIEFREHKGEDDIYYLPVFSIKTCQNEEITYTHHVASSTSKWKLGQTKAFVYDPNEPKTVWPLSYWGIFGWTLLYIIGAVEFLVIGFGYYFLHAYFNNGHFN
jgi:hypothetical protein